MSDILARICDDKRRHVAELKRERSLAQIAADAADAAPLRGFAAALRRAVVDRRTGLIAEIKQASPSHGAISSAPPAGMARAYAEGGAACLSVLTDQPYFHGCNAHLAEARAACALPVLRKDFIIDPWQVYETRAIGADCLLLILAALDDALAADLLALAQALGLDVLVEIHDADELARAAALGAALIGINNRNLRTLAIDLAVTEALAAQAPAGALLVSESGINEPGDIVRLKAAGVSCFLVGAALMRSARPEEAVAALVAAR
jgi:indole-3-glycerol phosphate synthase